MLSQITALPAADCPLCPRLVAFREQNTQEHPTFYNGAVPSFGVLDASLLIVGLAPGLKGANATGRPFTGDFAGEILYPALLRQGFATQQETSLTTTSWLVPNYQASPPPHLFQSEKLVLQHVRISNAVRCVPPENKPTPQEVKSCNRFLQNEIAVMPKLKVILALGLVSHQAVCRALGMKLSAHPFAHAAQHEAGQGRVLVNSYHTSRYNVNTNRLTAEMFDKVIADIKGLLAI